MAKDETRTAPTRSAVSEWMVNYIVAALDMQKQDFSPDGRFDSYGLDSAELVIMAGVMEEEFEIEINPEQFFETPTTTGVLNGLTSAGILRPE